VDESLEGSDELTDPNGGSPPRRATRLLAIGLLVAIVVPALVVAGAWVDIAADLHADLAIDGMGLTVADLSVDGVLDGYVSDLGDNEILIAGSRASHRPTRRVPPAYGPEPTPRSCPVPGCRGRPTSTSTARST
jgi:hypothetical protein